MEGREMNKAIHYQGQVIPVVEIPGCSNVFCPPGWLTDASRFERITRIISSAWPKTLWVVSSITHTLDGHPRSADPQSRYYGPSHIGGTSIDYAPIDSLDNPYGRKNNPRLSDTIPVILTAALYEREMNALFALEGNHFHVDIAKPIGIWAVPTYNRSYVNDARDDLSGRPLWRAHWNASLNAIEITPAADLSAALDIY